MKHNKANTAEGDKMELNIINKLFLELSQVATAKTNKEILLENTLKKALRLWKSDANAGDGLRNADVSFFNYAAEMIGMGQNKRVT